jgi:hypothetical protein
MNGGSGTVQYSRAIDPTVFAGPWAYVQLSEMHSVENAR